MNEKLKDADKRPVDKVVMTKKKVKAVEYYCPGCGGHFKEDDMVPCGLTLAYCYRCAPSVHICNYDES